MISDQQDLKCFIKTICISLFTIAPFLFIACNNFETKKVSHSTSPTFEIDTLIKLDEGALKIQTIARNLEVAWEIAYGSDGWIWFTEQEGQVSRMHPETGEIIKLLNFNEVFHRRSTGLLGMALHPNLQAHPYVYLNYTYKDSVKIGSKLVRYTFEKDTLVSPLVLYEVEGSTGHNGSRVSITPDLKILWASGDALKSENAQNIHSPNGKVLRFNLDGSIPEDNPFPGNPVWSWGHRNTQGLVATNKFIYTSEHGDANDDEINLIRKGNNYGWPDVTGYVDTKEENLYAKDSVITTPLRAWTPTIAPAGLDYYGSTAIPEWTHSLLLTTLKENDLRLLKLNKDGDSLVSEKIVLDNRYGRLRDLCISPEGEIFISTSNRDWNPGEGFPKPDDDRILRISMANEQEINSFLNKSNSEKITSKSGAVDISESEGTLVRGRELYSNYCASCHKMDGKGIQGSFPPLSNNELIIEDKEELIKIVLKGMEGPTEVNGVHYDGNMPSFDFLTDEKIAEILTYIRSAFGNQASEIRQSEISSLRGSD